MFKNTASQKIAVFAWDTANDEAKTGDASNITAQISVDGGACAATDDTNPTELDATDAPGIYLFDMTQDETNGDLIILYAVSSTDNIVLRPVIIYTKITAASINAEVVDALSTDTYAEPGQGSPGATVSLAAKIGYLYKAWRNKNTRTATQANIYNDAGDTIDQKATLSDDGTTFTRGEIATGP